MPRLYRGMAVVRRLSNQAVPPCGRSNVQIDGCHWINGVKESYAHEIDRTWQKKRWDSLRDNCRRIYQVPYG